MNKYFLFTMITLTLLAGCAPENAPEEKAKEVGIANPASVYCLEQGGTLDLRQNEAGAYGVCTLPDGTECEEWAYFRGECPETIPMATAEDIRGAFAAKYPTWDVDKLEIILNDARENFASGNVNEKGAVAGGGFFFAAKSENGWVIAADGNGSILCADIEPYKFPTDMIAECWNEESQTAVQR